MSLRYINNFPVITLLLILFLLFSCDDLSDDPLNENEKLSLIEELLPQSQAQLAFAYGHDYGVFSSLIMQQISSLNGMSLRVERYDINPEDTDEAWSIFYTNTLSLTSTVKQHSDEINLKKYGGISRAIMANTIGLITNNWGDVPFTENFLYRENNVTPAYDKQEDIYIHIFELLDEAESMIKDTESYDKPNEEDIFFRGDNDKWLRYINYLKLKYHLCLSNKQGYPEIAKYMEEPMFLEPGEALQVNLEEIEFLDNPFYTYLSENNDDLRAGQKIIGLMDDNDPRLSVYFQKNEDAIYEGSQAGAANSNASKINNSFSKANSKITLASFTEQKFMEAEILFEKGLTEQARETYSLAVESSLIDYDSFNQDWLDEFLDTHELSLEKIIEQKYVALFLQPTVWIDWRRTGFPEIKPALNNHTGDKIPRRLPYGQSEYERNYQNVPDDVEIWDPVWWDSY